MKTLIKNRVAAAILGSLCLVLSGVTTLHAALVPNFFLAAINNNTQTQITVLNADPNASVTLYYPVGGIYSSQSIGTTDSNGRLSTSVTPSTLNVTAGGSGYVIVNGARSQMQIWPTFVAASSQSSAAFSLSQTSVIVQPGQATAISVSAGSGSIGTLSVPSNSNSSVASVTISGTQVVVTGLVQGTTMATVCASNSGCASLNVIVQQQTQTNTQTTPTNSGMISVTPSTLNLASGGSQTVSISGPGSYYISAHTDPGVDSTSLSGSTLTIGAVHAGTDVISACTTSANTSMCTSLTVTVAQTPTTNTNTSTATISFSQDNVSLNVGQNVTVTVTGSGLGSYYVSNNSNSSSVAANMNGSQVTLSGIAIGGSNITICQLGGQCRNLYAFVPVSVGQTSTPAPVSNTPLALSSFSVSSNNVNNTFLGTGAALTVTFSANQAITNPVVSVNGIRIGTNGSGSGPYTAIYTLNGAEVSPLPIDISFNASTGAESRSLRFTVGGASSGTVLGGSTASAALTFTSILHSGSTGAEVRELQKYLAAAGIYSGPITGTFGAQTEAALKKFQAKHGLDQVGVTGPATRALLNSSH